MMNGVLIAIIIVAGSLIGSLIYLIINTPVFTVQEKQAVIIERLGKFSRVVGPGMHIMWPFIEQRRRFQEGGELKDAVDQRDRVVNLPSQSVITADNVQLEVDSMAYYQIANPAKAVYGVDDVILAVNQLIKTVLRNVIGSTMLHDLLSGRDEINQKLLQQVESAIGDWGIVIRSVELQSVNPPAGYVEAMRKIAEAEIAKQAAITEAEGKKQAHILEGEGEAEKLDRLYKAIGPNEEMLKLKYLEALEKIADGKATKIFMPFPTNPSGKEFPQGTFAPGGASDNFFQQAFGMVAAMDAYKTLAEDAHQDRPSSQAKQKLQGQSSPIAEHAPKTPPTKKIIRKVIVKKPVTPADQGNKQKTEDSEQ